MHRGCAPEARAAAKAIRPMGPAPQITAPWPSDKRARSMPCITTDRGSRRAPSEKLTLSGSLGESDQLVPCLWGSLVIGCLLVQPSCWVDFESLQCAGVRVDSSELDVFAEVIAALRLISGCDLLSFSSSSGAAAYLLHRANSLRTALLAQWQLDHLGIVSIGS